MATKETPVSEQTTKPLTHGLAKYAIYKIGKKTASNPSGESLITVTFAPSIEAACELGREWEQQELGPRFRVAPI